MYFHDQKRSSEEKLRGRCFFRTISIKYIIFTRRRWRQRYAFYTGVRPSGYTLPPLGHISSTPTATANTADADNIQKPLQKLSPHTRCCRARMFVFRVLFICSLSLPLSHTHTLSFSYIRAPRHRSGSVLYV